jgi:hypothetical protein
VSCGVEGTSIGRLDIRSRRVQEGGWRRGRTGGARGDEGGLARGEGGARGGGDEGGALLRARLRGNPRCGDTLRPSCGRV